MMSPSLLIKIAVWPSCPAFKLYWPVRSSNVAIAVPGAILVFGSMTAGPIRQSLESVGTFARLQANEAHSPRLRVASSGFVVPSSTKTCRQRASA